MRGDARIVVTLLCACLCAVASAQPPPDETPWGKGVSAERKAAAEQLLSEGNSLFVQNRFPEALAKYQEAIAQWDHPAIHFNIVRALLALDRPLDAEASLDKALAYGRAPIEDHYTEALNYKRLIESRLGTLEIGCQQPGVVVKLDGAQVLTCPGRTSKRLLPGNHVVVGAKRDHQTETKDVIVHGGHRQKLDITLLTIAQATVYTTRWAKWKPWAVAGGGLVVGGVGLLLQWQAKSDLDQLKRSIVATCPTVGCTRQQYDDLGHANAESRVELQSQIAIATMIAGGAIVTAGIVAVILNRPRPYIREHHQPAAARMVPSFTPHGAGLVVEARF